MNSRITCPESGLFGWALVVALVSTSCSPCITLGATQDTPTSAVELLKKSPKRTPWEKAFKSPTRNFIVITNTSQKLAKDLSLALEQQYQEFVFRFQIRKQPKKQLPVKIFAEKAEFRKYVREQGKSVSSERTAGYFDPKNVEVVLYWSNDTADVLETLYHEVTHYFVSLYAPRRQVPLWMDEGLAVYFETAQFKNGRLRTGQIPYGRLLHLQEAIKAGNHHRLPHLMKMNQYGDGGYDLLAYAEGWSVVYFFAKSAGGRNARYFGKFMDEVKRGRTQEVAFKRAFNITPRQLEPVWKKWVLSLGMKSAQGWYERARTLYYEDKNNEALAACDKGLKIDPKHALTLHLRGQVLFWIDKHKEAHDALEKAIKASPTDAVSYYYFARSKEHLMRARDPRGSPQEQEKAYFKAIALKPDFADALGLLAWLYATTSDPKLQKIKEAIPIAERAVQLDPTAEMLDTLAECYFQDKQFKKAVEYGRKALAANPHDKRYFMMQLKKFEMAAARK